LPDLGERLLLHVSGICRHTKLLFTLSKDKGSFIGR
jgi:hypothetical protein